MTRLSASQVETFDPDRGGCPRKWSLRYIAKIRTPPHPSAALGTRVHSVMEAWLRDGTAPALDESLELPDGYYGKYKYWPGQIFSAAMNHFPAPRTVTVEGKFEFVSNVLGQGAVAWTGFKDASWVNDQGVPVVADLKTTKSFQYQKRAEDLAVDTQANLYAYEAMQTHRTDVSIGHWVTVHTRDKVARPVTYTFSRGAVEEQVARIERVGHRILKLYQEQPNPADVETQTTTCDAFGGCPYRGTEHCKLSVADYFSSDFDNSGGEDMSIGQSFTDFLLTAPQGLVEGAPPPPVVVAPPPVVVAPVILSQVMPPPLPPMIAVPGAVPPPAVFAPPPVVVAPPPPVSPYWIPGQPMGPAQEQLAAQGKPLSVIASAASNPPPAHIAAAYDFGGAVTDRAHINAPEGPAYAPASPEQMPPVAAPKPARASAAPDVTDDLTPMTRDELKAMALAMGAVEQSSRAGDVTLRGLIRAHRKTLTPPPAVVVSAQEGLRAALHTVDATPVPLHEAQVQVQVQALPPPPVAVSPVAVAPAPVVVAPAVVPWIVLDLETTGLRQDEDVILECAAIAVDPATLEEIGSFHVLVPQALPAGIVPYVIQMHAKSGLWEELAGTSAVRKVAPNTPVSVGGQLDVELRTWLISVGASRSTKLMLAGNSVHFDLGFLRVQCPGSSALLSHRIVDVTSFREVTRAWSGMTLPGAEGMTHRAMDDARASLAQLRNFRAVTTKANADVESARSDAANAGAIELGDGKAA